MDNLEAYLKECEEKLSALSKKCDEAEKKALVLTTEIKNLESQRDAAVNECEQLAGVPFNKVKEVLDQKTKTLESIMAVVNNVINLDTDNKEAVLKEVANLKKLSTELGLEGA